MSGYWNPELISLRPRHDQHYISQDHTCLIVSPAGFIERPEDGLMIHQTRAISRYRYLIGGKPPQHAGLSPTAENSWIGYYIAPAGDGTATSDTIELHLARWAGHGMHEEIALANHSQRRVTFRLDLEIDADFADQLEMSKPEQERKVHGSVERRWESNQLVFDFHASHRYDHQGETGESRFHQSIAVRVQHSDSPPEYSEGKISFEIALDPHGSWHACVDAIPTVGERRLDPLYPCGASASPSDFDRKREHFLEIDAAHYSTPETGTISCDVLRVLRRASRDLAALRFFDLGGENGWVPAAGLPEYQSLFGRDTITAAWQASQLSTAMARGTLFELGRRQGTERNDWRDEQPGKIIHQATDGPLPELNFVPFARYYGTLTSSSAYAFAVAALWQWTGDRELIRPHLQTALKALAWCDRDGDPDGDGFVEYRTRSQQGLKNQGWKDSGDAIVYEDGSQVEAPIAPCEEQGFLYIAKLRVAEMLWWLDDKDNARRLFRQARELKKRFNDKFWMEKEGYFALGLDSRKRQIRSIASNAGHLLESAIIDSSLARRTVDRMMADDMFSGWGIRTLSSRHPAYNPFSYQRGSVWPVEHGMFALGMLRYGLHDQLERIAHAQFEAAALFEHHRLPELFSGHARDDAHPFPAVYPNANWPQAWSASSVFCLIYALLGTFPYAPLNTLFVDPHLPSWLPEITISNLRVGGAVLSIRFWRKENGASDYRIEDLRGNLHVVRQPSPWSLTAGAGERIEDALSSLLPGR